MSAYDRERHAAVAAALRGAGTPEDDAERLTEAVLDALDELAAARASLSGPASLHKDASEAQKDTVAQLEARGGLPEVRLMLLRAVSTYPEGVTCDHLEGAMDGPHHTFSSALNYLEQKVQTPLVMRNGFKVQTRLGGWAGLYEVTNAGIKYLHRLDSD